LDVPEPPKIVLEQPAPCSDGQKAAETLRRALAPSLAPRPAWTVSVRFERASAHLSAEGEITDELGAPVAHRAMKQDSGECSALARAVGVWASLVLDAEIERASAAAAKPTQPAASAASGASGTLPRTALPVTTEETASSAPLWPAPAPREKPQPEARLLLAHPEGERTIEVGATTFLMGGTGSGIVAGPSAFAVFEVGRGWFLRPTVAIARTLEDLSPSSDATWGAARFDACGRVPGFYLERRGIQLDICGGAEGGFLEGNGWLLPFAAVGPSMGLRGELGGDLSAMVRAVAEVNLLRDTSTPGVDPDLFVGRAEVGLSWRIR
jgi:hypothetical protein